jgi:hypothetical protein
MRRGLRLTRPVTTMRSRPCKLSPFLYTSWSVFFLLSAIKLTQHIYLLYNAFLQKIETLFRIIKFFVEGGYLFWLSQIHELIVNGLSFLIS